MRLHYIQHVPFEGPGTIQEWADKRDVSLTAIKVYEDEPFPGLDGNAQSNLDGLIVMGGPMGVHDVVRHPWLEQEKAFIRSFIRAKKPILGICLGAQLLADAFGARVYPNRQKEIGWFPIRFTEASRMCRIFEGIPASHTVLHWHGDTFSLPESAVHIAESDSCKNQAFLVDDRFLGLQFHLETDEGALKQLAAHCNEELRPESGSSQSAGTDRETNFATVASAEELFSAVSHCGENAELMETILDRLFSSSDSAVRRIN